MTGKVAYLGPAGTFTEAAALGYARDGQLVPYGSVRAIATAIVDGETGEGVVPIENSLEGSVTDTLDLLIHDSLLSIRFELVIPIEHCLLARAGTRTEDIRVIYSHPQAIAQCRDYLDRELARATPVSAMSTAAAAERLQEDGDGVAAIGTLRAAELYGMDVLARGIQDNPSNVTRFVVLAHSDHPPTGNDKTSLAFSFQEDRPGLLYAAIGVFATRNINLLKVESRPTKQSLGRYVFLLDLAGHREDPPVKQALDALQAQVSMLKLFGSYPRHADPTE